MAPPILLSLDSQAKASDMSLSTTASLAVSQNFKEQPTILDTEHAQTVNPARSSDPPDGGLVAWLTIAGAWMVQFSTFGYTNAFGVYQDYYTTHFLTQQTSSDISWIGSLQLCLMYAPGVFVGKAFDAGLFHHMEIAGSILYVLCIFMLSLAKENQYYQVFLAQAIGMGIGLGMTFLPSLSIVSHHFRKRRALAMGIVISGSSAGGIVFPIMLNHLIASPHVGFANAVRASGGLAGGMLLIANCLMRTRLLPKPSASRKKWTEMKEVIWDAAYLWSIAGAFLTSLAVYVPLFYLQLFAVDHGVTTRITTYSLAILNAGSVTGRLVPTFLADKLGVYNMLLPSIFMCAALIFSIFGATNPAGVVLVGLLFGFASGAYTSLIPSLLAALCNDIGELGIKMGCAYSVVAAAMLTGTPIAGALLGSGSSSGVLKWWRAIIFTGICALVGLACMTVSRTYFARRKGRQIV